MIKLFCNHKYSTVNEQGFQYCTKCNKAKFVKVPECNHTFEIKSEFKKTNTMFNKVSYTYLLKCSKCGELKRFDL